MLDEPVDDPRDRQRAADHPEHGVGVPGEQVRFSTISAGVP
jgi:hypothetical protein